MNKNKKIYLNREPVTGPWGGGNKTLSFLCEEIVKNGFDLTFNLEDNIDIIFCFDPRPNKAGEWYQDFINYKAKNKNCKIIQRVGDVGTHSKPDLTNMLTQIAKLNTTDYFIFPSEWSKKMINYEGKNFSIIFNKPLQIFHNNRKIKDNIGDTINIVTHHWSDNPKKGFSLYEKLGKYIKKNKIGNKKVKFTYIGRYSKKHSKEGIEVISPKSADELALILPQYDVYLTASIEEAGANHVLEAMACNLPVLYHSDGGSIVEYCNEFGLSYDNFDDMITKIAMMTKNYISYNEKVSKYNEKINNLIDRYIEIIKNI